MSNEKINKEFEEVIQTKKYKNLAFWTLVVFFGGFLLWGAFVPLDEGVPTLGKVVVDTKRKAVQHSTGGTIKEIFVREGDFVEKDQILIKLGDSKALSDVLIEENNIKSLEESVNLQRISLSKLSGLTDSVEKQISLVKEEFSGIRSLVEDGYAPKVQQIALEKELNELLSKKNENKSVRQQTLQSIEELKFRQRAAAERLAIAERTLKQKEIKASVQGQVVDLQKQAIGAVIRPAEKIMDIVPQDEMLLIETEIMPNLIDRVAVGDDVDIRFSNFSLTPLLVVPGKVLSISTDVLFQEKTKLPYYLARVLVTEEGLDMLGNRKMRPGMEASVIVKTGSRTLLTYLLHPLTRRVAFSMKEE